ncbi:hypothetical protein ACF3MZ_10780 [Paenibacillaceae bacterium WGS1546]|uniref:hypothetical protein n=1 Tax=Cohnella sp. WGS1546 TaxID=3366810 RepID=UPI00372CFA4D
MTIGWGASSTTVEDVRVTKRKEFVNLQREVYDTDPRFMLEQDGSNYVALDKVFSNLDEIGEEDVIVYHMSPEEKARIQQAIVEYDVRPPFDEGKCKEEFCASQEWRCKEAHHKLPEDLSSRIADMRVFALGIYDELYRADGGYEVHILFSGKGMPELIIRCADIIVEQE